MDQLLVSAHTLAARKLGLTQGQIGYWIKKHRDHVNDDVIFKTT